MKKILVLLILSCVIFVGFKKSRIQTATLGKDCKIEYVLAPDGKKVLGMKIMNGNSLIQVGYSEDGDDYSLSIENDENICCRMNASPEHLYSYSLEDKKSRFECAGNVMEDGNASFVIRTFCYEDISNVFVETGKPSWVQKQIVFDGKECHFLNLSADGKHETKYTDDLYRDLYGARSE